MPTPIGASREERIQQSVKQIVAKAKAPTDQLFLLMYF